VLYVLSSVHSNAWVEVSFDPRAGHMPDFRVMTGAIH
jgi:hypothetical protein